MRDRKLLYRVVSLVLLIVAAASGQAASAQEPGHGRIVYSGFVGGSRDIYSMKLDGTGILKLTNDAKSGVPACLGSGKIAFTSTRSGNNDIYVMNWDGSNQIRVTTNTSDEDFPTWSPDGRKIVFSRYEQVGGHQLWVINVDGTGEKRLTWINSGNGHQPAWSPDGSKIAFSSSRSSSIGQQIWVMNADGSNPVNLSKTGNMAQYPSWSPDGGKVVFIRSYWPTSQIKVINADGTNEQMLFDNAGISNETAWSPDGKHIAFASTMSGGSHKIHLMNSDGSFPIRLTNGDGDRAPCFQTPGTISFTEPAYSVVEGIGKAILTLTRTGATNGRVSAKVTLADVTTNSADYHFQPGALDPTFAQISAGSPYYISQMALQPDGKLLVGSPVGRFNSDGSPDASFNPGNIDGSAQSIAVQPDGKIIISGDFTTINNIRKNKIARLNSDGSLDATFDAGAGLDDWATSIIVQPDKKILIGGYFTSVNLTRFSHVARLHSNGSLDTTFIPPTASTVYSMALQPDGRLLAAGPFPGVVRYNQNGSKDTTFAPDYSHPTYSVVLQPDGKILIGGAFDHVGNVAVNNVARLNSNGSLDKSFNTGTGASSTVNTLVPQPDGKVLIAGTFDSFNGTSTSNIARLNGDGSLDAAFDAPSAPVNSSINTMLFQADGKIIIGGDFTMSGSNFNRNSFARLDNDLFVTWGDEDLADKTITLPIVDDLLDEADETLSLTLNPLSAMAVTGVNAGAMLTIVDNDVPPAFTGELPPSRATRGVAYSHTFTASGSPAPAFSVTAGNLPPGLFLTSSGLLSGVPVASGIYSITVTAANGVSPAASQTFTLKVNSIPSANINNYTLAEDTGLPVAAPGVLANDHDDDGDALSAELIGATTKGALTFGSDGSFNYTPNANVNGTDSFTYRVTDGSAYSSSTTVFLTITAVNDAPLNNVPGAQEVIENTPLIFSEANGNPLSVSDIDAGSGFVRLTLTATGGAITLSSIAGLTFTSGDGTADAALTFSGNLSNVNAAINGLRFIPSNGFSGMASLQIGVNDQGNTGSGGALADLDTISISVLDAGVFQFGTATYSDLENTGNVTITVLRTGGSAGAASVNYATSNGTATAGLDYTPATGILNFAAGENARTFNVSIIEDALVEGNESLNLQLSNPTGGATLGNPAVAVLTILDNDTCSYSINTASRTSPAAGETLTVNLTTQGACPWTAVSNSNFINVADGASGMGDGVVRLSISPNNTGTTRTGTVIIAGQTLTIIQPELPPEAPAIQFEAALYQISEGVERATLVVTRSGDESHALTVEYQTVDDPAAVPCSTANGTAYARCDYATTIDTVAFAPGEVRKEISLPLLDDAHVEGNETLQLKLSNATGGATLGAQRTAQLTIIDNDSSNAPNPIFSTRFFVRMQYLDFLSREPEADEPWSKVLNGCSDVNNNPVCDRLIVSQSFFGSPEFRLKGFYVFNFYRAAFNRRPAYEEIIPDMRGVTGATAAEVYGKRAAFAVSFAARDEFKRLYDALSDTAFVDTLLDRYGLGSITSPDPANPEGETKIVLTRADLINRLSASGAQSLTRAQVLRAVVESSEVAAAEYNRAFVAMQYYGYLRRTPEEEGYQAWLKVINEDSQNVRVMVNGFMNSVEYRLRFGQP